MMTYKEYFLRAEFDANWDDTKDLVFNNHFIKFLHPDDETFDQLIMEIELNDKNKQNDTIEISFKIRDLFQMLVELILEKEE